MRPTPLTTTVARHNQRRDMMDIADQARRRRAELKAHAAPGDHQRLRMIPVIGTPGAMRTRAAFSSSPPRPLPGTRPDHAIGNRRRRHRRP